MYDIYPNRGGYLKRIYVIQFPDDIETKANLKGIIKYLFIGNPETIYNLLANYPIENDLLGKEISSYMITSFLENQFDISFRKLHRDERIIPRIEQLNSLFDSSFIKINNTLIKRTESERCIKEILNGNSIIIHGKAGNGKSGCIIELINKLKEKEIPHLALKLDQRVPEYSSNKYGEQLNLPASPVFCLDAISKDKEAVFILDQLDAIRWTNSHSRTALEVCKEMIEEVNNINKDRDKKITLIFICRTFDFQNDNGIKQLFSKSDIDNKEITWKEIKMNDLDDEIVKNVVGEIYGNLSIKLKTLLKTPNNLYIWSNIDEKKRSNTYNSSSELIDQWWTQLSINSEINGISTYDLSDLKNTIVNRIESSGKLMIPVQMINHCSKLAIEHLLSSGLLFSESKRIGFVHQSFYDYFLVEKMIQQIFEGDSIVSILGPPSKQTPAKRYQLQMLLENLQEYDMDNFIDEGNELLDSDNIRFYMKYAFLEVLGQVKSINLKMETFLKRYIKSEYWKDHLFDAVFMNRPKFIKFLIQEGYIKSWLNFDEDRESVLLLLSSVNSELSNEIPSILYPLAFENIDLDISIYNVLCRNIEDDSDEMFNFRIELLNRRPQLWNKYISWEDLAKEAPKRALSLIKSMMRNINTSDLEKRQDLYDKSIISLIKLAKAYPNDVWEAFMPYIIKETSDIVSIYDNRLDFWQYKQDMWGLYGKAFVEMAKASGGELIRIDVESLVTDLEKHSDCSSFVINEILLFVMGELPIDYSDYVINWLVENPQKRFFDYTGNSDEYLHTAKIVIEKHSKTCSTKVFRDLEKTIYYYHEEDELRIAERRFNYNKENKEKNKKSRVYSSFWGEVQRYLIPALDDGRISRKTHDLEGVLKRRFNDKYLRHKRDNIQSGIINSTIGIKAEKISDKEWLKILRNKDYRKGKWPENNVRFLESSPWQFSRDFAKVGERNPNRFANLSLRLPIDIDNHYIGVIFDLIAKKEVSHDINEGERWSPVHQDLAQRLYKKWLSNEDINVAISFCRGVRERAEEPWDKEILDAIVNKAINHSNPAAEEFNIISSDDEDGNMVESLLTNSINNVRGCAAGAIASLLWEDKARYAHLRDAVASIVSDENLSVNMAAVQCIIPIMNFDKDQASEWLFQLANKDLRVVAHPSAYRVFYHLYKEYSDIIEGIVLEMYKSKFEDVAKIGANHVSNMYVLYGIFADIIFKDNNKSKNQKKGIIESATNLIVHQKHYEKCKEIIVHFLDEETEDDLSFSFARLLSEDKLKIVEDEQFIRKIVTSKSTRLIIRQLITYINENDLPIIKFKDVIFDMSKSIIHNSEQETKRNKINLYGIASELSILIALIYDQSQYDYAVSEVCLNIWDKMFEKRIGTTRELTKIIMDI